MIDEVSESLALLCIAALMGWTVIWGARNLSRWFLLLLPVPVLLAAAFLGFLWSDGP